MLYKATRNNLDTFTSHRSLYLNKAADGGFLLPMNTPVFLKTQIEQMRKQELLQNTAQILNVLFDARLTAWDLESVVGKVPLKQISCGQKTAVVQCWMNPGNSLTYMLQSIFNRLCNEKGAEPTTWARTAIRASLIGAAALNNVNEMAEKVDIAVNAGDFEQAFAAYYCRLMGFPIRKILIACNENSAIWDFAYRGSLNCGMTLQRTAYPALDKVVPDLFEPYVYLTYGPNETGKFVNATEQMTVYQLPEDAQLPVNDDLFVSVISQDRIQTVISSFQSNNGVRVHPYTAFSLGVLQDYRAKAGDSILTLLFEEQPA